jgi:hypothetical protein
MNKLQLRRLSPTSTAFLGGFALTNIGNGAYTVAVGSLLYQSSHSVVGFALVLYSEFWFKLVLQGVSRFDRVPAVRICLAADTCRAAAMAAAVVLLWHSDVYAAVALTTLAINFFKPFYISASFRIAVAINPPELLEKYNAWFIVAKQSGYLVGIGLYAVVLYHCPVSWIFLINCGSYLGMLLALLQVRRRGLAHEGVDPAGDRPRARGGWGQTFELLRDRALVRQVLLASHDSALLYILSLYVLAASKTSFSSYGGAQAVLQGSFVLGTAACLLLTRSSAEPTWQDVRPRWIRLAVAELVLVLCLYAGGPIWWACASLFVLGLVCSLSSSYQMARLMRFSAGRNGGRIAGLQLLLLSGFMLCLLPLTSWLTQLSLRGSGLVPVLACLAFIVGVSMAPTSATKPARGADLVKL